ncbi:MAG: alkaline phosphatase family protein, partial [Candidatus Binatia bacterium]
MRMQEKRQAEESSARHNRIIVLGLDSADPDLVQLWAREGRLPFLTSLQEQGTWTRLISTRGLFNDAPWMSFHTGVSPAQHGFYNYLQIKRGTTEIMRLDGRWNYYWPFWRLLRESGKKVAVFDVPKTYPVEGLDGIQIAAWGEHYPLMRQSLLPASIGEELVARFGKYAHPREIASSRRFSDEQRILDCLQRNIEQKAEAVQFLFSQDDWDLFAAVFAESHYAGHQFYHHFDRQHWAHSADWAERFGQTLPTLYAQLDATLAALLRNFGQKATIFIVSVHGIETNYSANHLLPAVLERLGFQVPAVGTNGEGRATPSLDWSGLLRRMLPRQVRTFINERLLSDSYHDKVMSRRLTTGVDWRKTTAFFLPSDHFQGFLSLNLKGREPWGTVAPGAEYDEVCSRLSEELNRLMNPDTGKPAVNTVVKVSDVYQGVNLYCLPDLVVQWATTGPIRRL